MPFHNTFQPMNKTVSTEQSGLTDQFEFSANKRLEQRGGMTSLACDCMINASNGFSRITKDTLHQVKSKKKIERLFSEEKFDKENRKEWSNEERLPLHELPLSDSTIEDLTPMNKISLSERKIEMIQNQPRAFAGQQQPSNTVKISRKSSR